MYFSIIFMSLVIERATGGKTKFRWPQYQKRNTRKLTTVLEPRKRDNTITDAMGEPMQIWLIKIDKSDI